MSDPNLLFDHRLGLALGKTISEIRSMPFSEYMSWKRFYLVEPWGWHNEEYRLAALLAMTYNVNRGKRTKARTAADFIRDVEKALDQALAQAKTEKAYKEMSREEKREFIKRRLRMMLPNVKI